MGRPQFRSLMLFENTSVVPDQSNAKLLFIQPILNFVVPFIPTQLSFSALGAFSHFNLNQKYLVEMRFIDGTTQECINSISWEILERGEGELAPPSGMVVAEINNMIVRNEGAYYIELLVDGEKIGEQVAYIYQQREVKHNALTN